MRKEKSEHSDIMLSHFLLILLIIIFLGAFGLILFKETVGLFFLLMGYFLVFCRKKLMKEESSTNSISPTKKRIRILFMILVILLCSIYVFYSEKTPEQKIIEVSKRVFDQYAPNYNYLEKEDNWLVSFNNSDGSGTITVWAPTDTPDSKGVFLRGCVMFERTADGQDVVPYFVSVDHNELYHLDRQNTSSRSNDDTASAPDEDTAPTEQADYSDINSLFANIVSDSDISISKQGSRISVQIKSALSADNSVDGWDAIVDSFNSALEKSHELAANYGAVTVSSEIYASDESILLSGYNGAIKYNLFGEKSEESGVNPSTISKFEYDQISVGMSLSEVTEIIGGPGTAQTQIGDAGGYGSLIVTYRWLGEANGSYADILFDDYKVYSKMQLFLE